MGVTNEMKNLIEGFERSGNYAEDVAKRIIELHEQSKPKPEPVAYLSMGEVYFKGCIGLTDAIKRTATPLYTTPPTREPLSEDKLDELINDSAVRYNQDVYVFDNSYDLIQFARAIEQAHGIGVAND